MKHLRLIKKLKETEPVLFQTYYEELVVEKIRAKYSLNQELAILRQRDSKIEEFNEYNTYVEACKAEAKAELEINN